MKKYLLRNTNTNVIDLVYDMPVHVSPPLEVIEIPATQFKEKMIKSIFTDVNNYKEFPGWGKKENWWESNGTDWVDTRDDETVWNHVRQQRNKALQECDWTQLNDADLTDEQKADWVAYRNTLRNIPNDNTNPRDAETALNTMIQNQPRGV